MLRASRWGSEVGKLAFGWGEVRHACRKDTEYTRGEFALVRAVARQFEGIAVENDVRAMFVDPRDGAPLFAPTTKSAR